MEQRTGKRSVESGSGKGNERYLAYSTLFFPCQPPLLSFIWVKNACPQNRECRVPSTMISSQCDPTVMMQTEMETLATTRILHIKHWGMGRGEKMQLRKINLTYSCSSVLWLVIRPKLVVIAASYSTFCVYLTVWVTLTG